MEEEKKKLKSPLRDQTMFLKIVKRKGGWLSDLDESHDGANLWSNARITFTGTPFVLKEGRSIDPLTPDERAWFESDASGLGLKKNEMSVLKKGNYWESYTISVDRNGKSLKLNTVTGYLEYKFLLCQTVVAPDWGQRFDRADYRFAMLNTKEEALEKVTKATQKKDAYMFFGKLSSSSTEMILFLTLYNIAKKSNKLVPQDSDREFYIAELDKIIEQDLNTFLEIAQNEDYQTRAFIQHGLLKGAIEKASKAKYRIFGEDEVFTMIELVEYLKDTENQLIYGKLKATIEG